MTERVEIHHIKHISGFNDKGEIYSRTMPIEWVGLTYEEVQEILLDPRFQLKPVIVHAVEQRLKEKNHYA